MHAIGMTPFRILCAAALTAVLLQPAVGRAAVNLPNNTSLERVDFERHIMGLFGRMGCNSGSCHGSFQGKGGFRLSLFGYDPEFDYVALTRDNQSRRINPSDPDSSLILLKATGEIEHIDLNPPEFSFKKAGEQGSLRVVATFADDSQEDITLLCDFRTN